MTIILRSEALNICKLPCA